MTQESNTNSGRGKGRWSTRVGQRYPFEDGELASEYRLYRRKKDGELSEYGPYWIFRYIEGGERKPLYLGKTDDPEGEVHRKRGR